MSGEKPQRGSIAGKLMVLIVGVVLTTVTITTMDSLRREIAGFNDFTKRDLTGTAQVLASAVATPMAADDSQSVRSVLTAMARLDGVMSLKVAAPDGATYAQMGQAVILPEKNIAVEEEASLIVLLRTRSMSATVPVIKAGQEIGTLTIYQDVSSARQNIFIILRGAGQTALLACLLGIIAAWLLQKRISSPIRQLAEVMSGVRETSDFSVVAYRTTNDEVGTLVEAFNDMLGNIRERDDKLAAHRRDLEKTVMKRTLQFRKAREELGRSRSLSYMSEYDLDSCLLALSRRGLVMERDEAAGRRNA